MNLLELNAIIEALEPFVRYRESIYENLPEDYPVTREDKPPQLTVANLDRLVALHKTLSSREV